MLNGLLFKKIDNSALLIFRIFFGILISLECFGAIATGWVRRNLIDPQFTFSFIDFEWLQPLPGSWMYVYFSIMGLLGICIALGFKYRISCMAFTLLWTSAYLMQKTAYNNHYYLLVLISFLMCFFPAHKGCSLDVRLKTTTKETYMFAYVKWIIVLQLFIVYTYASIAKLYADWLDFSMIKILMQPKVNYPIIGRLLQELWMHKIIGSFGIIFDFLIIPALLWKPSRKIAFGLSIFFHLFNSIVFQIGIFPYLSLAFTVFFFDPELIRSIFFKTKKLVTSTTITPTLNKNAFYILFSFYFLLQLMLPIRHHFIKDNVLWTEEGHRMSWRMMLRSRSGTGKFVAINNFTGEEKPIRPEKYLTRSQSRKVFAYPDFTWQFAQYLKKQYSLQGEDISIYVKDSKININGRGFSEFIDPNVDLANTPWNRYEHANWILPSNLN